MKTKYLTISLLALIAATFLLNPAAFAFEKGRCEGSWDMKKHQHEKKMKHFIEKLNLSEAQQEELKAQREKHHAEFQGLREELKVEHGNLRQEFENVKPNRKTLRRIAAKITKIKGQMLNLHIDKVLEMKEVLSEEQCVKLKELRKEHKEKGKGFGEKFKSWWHKHRK